MSAGPAVVEVSSVVLDQSQLTDLRSFAALLGVPEAEIVHEALKDWLEIVGPARLDILYRKYRPKGIA